MRLKITLGATGRTLWMMGLYIVNPQSPRDLLNRKFISEKLGISLALSAAVGLNNALCLSESCGMPHLILPGCLER